MISPGAQSGFTLIETIVTMAILAMVLGIVLGFQSGQKNQVNISIYQEKTRALIARAKGLALNNPNPKARAYGVHIDSVSGQAFIYIDAKAGGSFAYDANDPGDSLGKNSLDYIKARDGVFFKDVTNPSSPVDQVIDIAFEPPDPTVYLYKNQTAVKNVEIGLVIGNLYRKVTVNQAGQISTLNK